MKRTLLSLAVIGGLTSSLFADDLADMKAELKALNEKVIKLEKKQKRTNKTLSKVKKNTSNDNVKWSIDFRTAYDNLDYKLKNGSTVSNSALFTNRLWLGMAAKATDNLTFKGQ